jgi:hypothetical protein
MERFRSETIRSSGRFCLHIMNRRFFVGALVATPLIARLPGEPTLAPRAERRYRSLRSDFAVLTVEVRTAWTERVARGMRNRQAHDPFNGLKGEFYIENAYPVELPDHLPGTVTTYATVVGYAAEKGVIHIGGFRRGTFVWTVRVNGGPVQYVIEAAEAIAAFDLPDAHRVPLVPSLLDNLLTEPGHFSRPVEIVTE